MLELFVLEGTSDSVELENAILKTEIFVWRKKSFLTF